MVKIISQTQFRKHVLECIDDAETIYNIDFGRVTITFDLKGYTAADARFSPHPTMGQVFKLRFNKEAIKQDWDMMVESTIPHEVAHLVCFAKPEFKSENHDRIWRAIAIRLGDRDRGMVGHTLTLTSTRRPTPRNY